jgi:hypothetical protein
MYILGVKPWQSAKWVAPPPEEIAKIRRDAGTAEDSVAEAGEARNDASTAATIGAADSNIHGPGGVRGSVARDSGSTEVERERDAEKEAEKDAEREKEVEHRP